MTQSWDLSGTWEQAESEPGTREAAPSPVFQDAGSKAPGRQQAREHPRVQQPTTMGLFTVLDPENRSQSTKDVLFCSFFMEPLSFYCLRWAVALQTEQVVKKCQMQLYWLRIISQKYTLTLRLFK